jgi:hypothetical protein
MTLKTYITRTIEWLKGSVDNLPGGASSKKLTAWGSFIIGAAITIIWSIASFQKGDWSLLPIILPMWLGLVYAALNLNSKEKEKGLLGNDGGEVK